MRIDIHNHFLHREHMAEEAARLSMAHGLSQEKLLGWTPELALETMDRNRIDLAIGSISTPGVWYGDVAAARRLARRWNEESAKIVQKWPQRFGMFAVIAPPDIDGALGEIDYALGVLKAEGVALLSNYDNLYPGDPAFAPVLEELNRRRAVVFIHPTVSVSSRVLPGILPQVIEFPFDTTRAIVSLIVNGCIAKYPDIRFIFSHAGGATPMLAARIDRILQRRPDRQEKFPQGARAAMQSLYFDVASSSSPGAIAALRELMPVSQILYGSDAPFVTPDDELAELDHAAFTAEERSSLEDANPKKLLPRFAN
ncbi:MAG: amidohydrolase family protein [Beijerinckiaceae bacterium]